MTLNTCHHGVAIAARCSLCVSERMSEIGRTAERQANAKPSYDWQGEAERLREENAQLRAALRDALRFHWSSDGTDELSARERAKALAELIQREGQ